MDGTSPPLLKTSIFSKWPQEKISNPPFRSARVEQKQIWAPTDPRTNGTSHSFGIQARALKFCAKSPKVLTEINEPSSTDPSQANYPCARPDNFQNKIKP
ncbi:Hypothetical predicted protein [Prunus dulcis]|uniref:Uncharacterized protein n=1 Tax=Prunus dulcis TaxID=3755 RepID=A0A5E4GIV3_PRUDU|nr:Hypothetical predicted protein [Prunus dulcis]